MLEKIICAGFGGQGVMSMGRLIAHAAMDQGLEVSWLPSYGPEMRGGTANCHVIVSSSSIGSPVVSSDATCVIALNLPSMKKFEVELVSDGLLIYNSSLINEQPERRDVRRFPIPANEIASEIGNLRAANMVMLGAFVELSGLLPPQIVLDVLAQMFGASKEQYLPLNEKALQRGIDAAVGFTTQNA